MTNQLSARVLTSPPWLTVLLTTRLTKRPVRKTCWCHANLLCFGPAWKINPTPTCNYHSCFKEKEGDLSIFAMAYFSFSKENKHLYYTHTKIYMVLEVPMRLLVVPHVVKSGCGIFRRFLRGFPPIAPHSFLLRTPLSYNNFLPCTVPPRVFLTEASQWGMLRFLTDKRF